MPGFIGAQLVGGMLGLALVRYLFPDIALAADDVVVPHPHEHNRQPHHDHPSAETRSTR